jgi:hypothetical protein
MVGLDAWGLGSGAAGSSPCRCWGSAEGEIVAGVERNSTNHASQGEALFWGGKKDIPCGILGRRLALDLKFILVEQGEEWRKWL